MIDADASLEKKVVSSLLRSVFIWKNQLHTTCELLFIRLNLESIENMSCSKKSDNIAN